MGLNVMNRPGGVVPRGEALDSLNALSGADFMAKATRANELGRKAFRKGQPCDPGIPLRKISEPGQAMGIRLMESWMNGWADESLFYKRAEGCSS